MFAWHSWHYCLENVSIWTQNLSSGFETHWNTLVRFFRGWPASFLVPSSVLQLSSCCSCSSLHQCHTLLTQNRTNPPQMGWVVCWCFSLNLLHFSSLKSWGGSLVCLEAHWRCCASTHKRSFSLKATFKEGQIKSTLCFCTVGKGQSWKVDQASSLTQTRPLLETWKCVSDGISKLSQILVWQSQLSPPLPLKGSPSS